jgi:hypothetical protein
MAVNIKRRLVVGVFVWLDNFGGHMMAAQQVAVRAVMYAAQQGRNDGKPQAGHQRNQTAHATPGILLLAQIRRHSCPKRANACRQDGVENDSYPKETHDSDYSRAMAAPETTCMNFGDEVKPIVAEIILGLITNR